MSVAIVCTNKCCDENYGCLKAVCGAHRAHGPSWRCLAFQETTVGFRAALRTSSEGKEVGQLSYPVSAPL